MLGFLVLMQAGQRTEGRAAVRAEVAGGHVSSADSTTVELIVGHEGVSAHQGGAPATHC
jgi:hypothetical protein